MNPARCMVLQIKDAGVKFEMHKMKPQIGMKHLLSVL